MDVVLFGATGMVGQGVLRECLRAPDVARVVAVGRSTSGASDPKLRELVVADLFDQAPLAAELAGCDACFFCLGVSSAGMAEGDYTRLTYELTLAVAETLSRLNPQMTFVYVSGAGTDGGESGRVMWARVKGRTENALSRLPFRAIYLLRPGIIQPLHGATSRTRSIRLLYTAMKPILPLLRRLLPTWVLTTKSMGQAMLAAARCGQPGRFVLEARAIAALARGDRS